MSSLKQYEGDFTLLVEGGFIAANRADEELAKRLFSASLLLNPENLLPKLGFGYVHLLKLELKQACLTFEEILKKDPHHQMARSLLGLSMALTTKEVDAGIALLEEALKKTEDQSVKNMSNTAIAFIEKFIKKTPTPVQGFSENKKIKKKGKK